MPNLAVYFSRHGETLSVTARAEDYRPGDIVTWNIANWWRQIVRGRRVIPHIGIVTGRKAPDGMPLIVHNIGSGTKLQNMLFRYEITGHYRFPGSR